MDREAYEKLANAVVLSAVKDYRAALKKLKKRPDSKAAMDEAMSVERFFRSDWFTALTKVEPDYLIEELRKEARAS